jgi:hypothetical protein
LLTFEFHTSAMCVAGESPTMFREKSRPI